LFGQLTKNDAVELFCQQEKQPSLTIKFVDSRHKDTCKLDDFENLTFQASSRKRIKHTALRMISILEQYYKQKGMKKKPEETRPKLEEVFNKRKRNNEVNRADNWLTRNRGWLYPQKRNSQKKSKPGPKPKKNVKMK
jgi:hypothetical protein